MIRDEAKALVHFVKIGLGREADMDFDPSVINWNIVFKLARREFVIPQAFDGYEKLVSSGRLDGNLIPTEVKRTLLGTATGMEQIYHRQEESIGKIASALKFEGVDMMILKGLGRSLDYPIPNHRQTGDLDFWAFGKWRQADAIAHKELGCTIDHSHHHHSVYKFEGMNIENHFDFLNVHAHRTSKQMEQTLKNLGNSETPRTHVLSNGTEVYLPGPNLDALFLARHAAMHFAGERMTLRQVLDWGFFVEKHGNDVDWGRFWSEMTKLNMVKFAVCLCRICYGHFSFHEQDFHIPEGYRNYGEDMAERIFEDIFYPECRIKTAHGFIRYIISRYRIWLAKSWKQELVFPESKAETLIVQAWSHLIKPSSLRG